MLLGADCKEKRSGLENLMAEILARAVPPVLVDAGSHSSVVPDAALSARPSPPASAVAAGESCIPCGKK